MHAQSDGQVQDHEPAQMPTEAVSGPVASGEQSTDLLQELTWSAQRLECVFGCLSLESPVGSQGLISRHSRAASGRGAPQKPEDGGQQLSGCAFMSKTGRSQRKMLR